MLPLAGYKTYITAALMILIALAKIGGMDVPGFSVDPGTMFASALGLIFARSGAANDAVRAIVLLAICLLAIGGPSYAANLSPVLKAPIAAKAAPDCTQLDCSGFIAGANIMGSGSNADILGSGLNGSVFAGGGLVGFDAGYQLWNGKFFGGVLASIDYDANMSGVVPNQGRVLGMLLLQGGVGLSGIFAPSAGTAPVGIPATIAAALVSPYLNLGAAIRQRGDAWVSGAGAEFDLSSAWLMRLDYLHLDYSHGQAAPGLGGIVAPSSVENLVKLSLLRKF